MVLNWPLPLGEKEECMEIPSFRVYRVQINRVILFCFVMLSIVNMCKGGKFLKKLWCGIGGEYYYKIIWFYQMG